MPRHNFVGMYHPRGPLQPTHRSLWHLLFQLTVDLNHNPAHGLYSLRPTVIVRHETLHQRDIVATEKNSPAPLTTPPLTNDQLPHPLIIRKPRLRVVILALRPAFRPDTLTLGQCASSEAEGTVSCQGVGETEDDGAPVGEGEVS